MPRRGVRRRIRPRGRCRPTRRPPRTGPARRRRSRRGTRSRRGCRASPPRERPRAVRARSSSGAAGAADAHAASTAVASAASTVRRDPRPDRCPHQDSPFRSRTTIASSCTTSSTSVGSAVGRSAAGGGLAHLLDESDDLREVASIRRDQQAGEERHDAGGDAEGELHDRRQPVRRELHAVRGAEAERREDHGPHDRAEDVADRARRCPRSRSRSRARAAPWSGGRRRARGPRRRPTRCRGSIRRSPSAGSRGSRRAGGARGRA